MRHGPRSAQVAPGAPPAASQTRPPGPSHAG
eukprot:CAMPEP_0118961344 /NCGR_PEP_ID=MMETSP1173-20130426/35_1 /TAXON_ID=1034831 /ORGANISM="Rhizochromulina marina cf, Strain CCMP1243" /LENGTH=30 /DNA_ID= /DNA_START= /DNA_END= /DNA_ORIENTATION=